MSAQLSWSHYCELLSFDNINKINYYIELVKSNNLSVRQLRERIKSSEYERIPEATKNKLIEEKESNVVDFIKNPIMIKNNSNYEIFSEKILQKLILEDIENFLDELGTGFTFIKSEYPIKLGNRYNYIDLFLYNIKYKCYVVVELKITELKKEHTGQIMTYMNYIDKNIKTLGDKTFHALVCHSLHNGWGENQAEVIKECFDNIPANDEPIATIAIGTGFVGMMSGANFRQIVCGMHDSKQQIMLHAGYTLDAVINCYNEEKGNAKKKTR